MADIIQLRRDTAANWTSVNPVLADGEMGIEKGPPIKFKMGDGVTAWNSLSYGMKGDQGIQGVAGSGTYKEVEIDFGANSVNDASFVITDIDVTTSSKIFVTKVLKSPSGGRHIDEIFAEDLDLSAAPALGSLTIYAKSRVGRVNGKFIINYLIG